MAPRQSARIKATAASKEESNDETVPKAVKAKKTEAKTKKPAAPKKTKKTAAAAATTDDDAPPTKEVEEEVAKTGISVTIEACKTCGGMTKAKSIVKALLGKAEAVINPEEPGKGNFVVRVNGGDPVVELLAMKRPFTPIKELDVEEVIAKILKAVEEVVPTAAS